MAVDAGREMVASASAGVKSSPVMNALTETLARATLVGGAFPPKARAPDFPLVTSFYLERAPDDAALETFARALASFPELGCRATAADARSEKTLRRLRWERVDDGGWLKRVKRVEVATVEELIAVTNEATLTPLDANAPLWDCVVVTRKKGGEAWDGEDEGFPEPPVVLLRVSHAIGDGIALVNVLKKISTALDGGEMRVLDFKRRERASRSFLALLWACVTFIFVCAYGFLKAVLTAAGPYDTKTVFKGSRPPYAFSGKRRVVVCPPVSMEDVKAIKNASGCTVNDIVVAALAGAIQKYLARVGDPSATKKPRVRAASLYAFPDRVRGALTNNWTFVSLALPMGVMSAAERLRRAQKTCNLMKRSPEPYVTRALNTVVDAAGPSVQRQVVFDYMTRHSMVFTNIPGPTEPIVFMGSRVRDIVFACSNLVNQVSALSYAGRLRLTLVVDPEATPEADVIGRAFVKEIDALRESATASSSM